MCSWGPRKGQLVVFGKGKESGKSSQGRKSWATESPQWINSGKCEEARACGRGKMKSQYIREWHMNETGEFPATVGVCHKRKREVKEKATSN